MGRLLDWLYDRGWLHRPVSRHECKHPRMRNWQRIERGVRVRFYQCPDCGWFDFNEDKGRHA